MGNYTKAGTTSEFKNGDKKKVTAGGQEILIARVGNSYYAISNRCPHMAGDLSTGVLEGNIITCQRHGSQFDVRDGKNVRWLKGSGLMSSIGKALKPAQSVKSYKVKVEGADILIEM